MIASMQMIDLGDYRLRADHVPTEVALAWLQRHLHACMMITFDREERTARWKVRWHKWPMILASGAGMTFDEAVSRCFQCAVERDKRFTGYCTEADFAAI